MILHDVLKDMKIKREKKMESRQDAGREGRQDEYIAFCSRDDLVSMYLLFRFLSLDFF